MSDQEEDYDNIDASDEEENDLDEIDQNDDIDANEDQTAEPEQDEEEEPEETIYGPLRTLKIRDGDHKTIIVIPSVDRRTSHIINDYEFTEAVGIRASQIERGAPVFTDVNWT